MKTPKPIPMEKLPEMAGRDLAKHRAAELRAQLAAADSAATPFYAAHLRALLGTAERAAANRGR